jgi:hypothetical protein
MLYSYAFILDPRAKMKGFFNVLELLGKATGCTYSLYYGDVKDELYRLFSKYEQKFGGSTRSQRLIQPSSQSGKRKQAWERSLEVLVHPLVFSPHLPLLHLL